MSILVCGLSLASPQGTYEPGKRHWLKVKKDYLNEGAMADTADLVVLGAFYGQGSKGQGGLWPLGWYFFERSHSRNRQAFLLAWSASVASHDFQSSGIRGPNLTHATSGRDIESCGPGKGEIRQQYPVLAWHKEAHHQLFLQGLAAFSSGKISIS